MELLAAINFVISVLAVWTVLAYYHRFLRQLYYFFLGYPLWKLTRWDPLLLRIAFYIPAWVGSIVGGTWLCATVVNWVSR